MPLPFAFDFKKPDYTQIFEWRMENLKKLKEKPPESIAHIRNFYKNNPAQYIIDWGCTYDPRNPERSLPALIPFILFPIQEELINFVFENWKNQKSCVVDKSRDMGVSEAMVAFACTMCFFWDGFSVGFGSRRKDYVDSKGDPKALLYKARRFIQHSPKIFRGEWDERKHTASMRINFPMTNAIITGDSGDQIGRGDRKSFYVPDEFGFIEHQELAQASLAATTNCICYVSTPNGPNVLYCKLATDGKLPSLKMNWRQDPRRNEEWAIKKQEELDNPIIWAREYENDHYGSMEGVIIPAIWVNAAIDAHIALNLNISGIYRAGLDIADEGKDKNALILRHGILSEYAEQWSGRNSDLYATTEETIETCDFNGYDEVYYDASMLGASIKGDAKRINDKRISEGKKEIKFNAFLGAGEVIDPEANPFKGSDDYKPGDKGITNADLFHNRKAQAWWALARRFQLTYRAVVEGKPFNKDDIISISSKINHLQQLKNELSQATFKESMSGKMLVNKTPDGMKSPNLADAMVIAYAPVKIRKGMYSDFRIQNNY